MGTQFGFTLKAGFKAGACASNGGYRFCPDSVMACATSNETTLLIATDGKTLSVVECEGAGPEKPMLLPAKSVNANGSDARIEVNGEVRICSGTGARAKAAIYPLPEQEGRMPNFSEVFPKQMQDTDDYTYLSIDASLLKQLSDAIAGKDGSVVLLVPPADKTNQVAKAIGVVGIDFDSNPQGIGMIMPLYNSDTSKSTSYISTRRHYFHQMVEKVPIGSQRFGA